jgi:predicted transcriptional regulator
MRNKNISNRTEKRNAMTYIIYELLKGTKLSTKEMAELVEKNQRTCERYVKDLEESDLPIRKDEDKYYLNTDDGYLPFYLPKEKINMIYISLISFSAFGRDLKLIAKKIGSDEAIFLEQLHNLIQTKVSNKKNLIDGETWVFNTTLEWRNDYFIFWNGIKIKRIIHSLIKSDLIKTHNYNLNKMNHKFGYTINYPKLIFKNNM